MATYNVNTAKHAVLTPSTVDTVNLTNPASFIIVSNRTTSGNPLYITFGDASKGVPDPTIGGDDTYIITIGMTFSFPGDGTSPQVKVISTSAQAYSVQVV